MISPVLNNIKLNQIHEIQTNILTHILHLDYDRFIKDFCSFSAIKERPKSMKLYIQSHAGPHNSSNIYKQKIQHLFEAANLIVDSTGIYVTPFQ